MSLTIQAPSSLVDDRVFCRYEPFRQKESMLPNCSFHIHIQSEPECAGFLSKNPAFSLCIGADYDSDTLPNAKNAGDYRLTQCEDGVVIRVGEPIWVWVHDDWRKIDVVMKPEMQYSPNLHALIMRAYQYTAIHANAILMHAAAVSCDGKGILFCGVPGAGKSTQARLWEQVFGAETINNDQPCIIYEDGRALVSGTPWSGKEPCYKNLCVPVRAIVFVEQSPADRVAPLSRMEAYGLLYLNEYVVPIQPETEKAYDDAIARIVSTVPVYRQACTMSVNAPKTLRKALDSCAF